MTTEIKDRKDHLISQLSNHNIWIVLSKLDEIVGHATTRYWNVNQVSTEPHLINRQNLAHVYFCHLTSEELITLIETVTGQLYFIHNSKVKEQGSEPVVVSNIHKLSTPDQIFECMSHQLLKELGICKRDMRVKEDQKSAKINTWSQFHSITDDAQYMSLFEKDINETLDLTHNYTINADRLARLNRYEKVTSLIMNQNYYINNLKWLSQLPELRHIHVYNCHQLTQDNMCEISQFAPKLETLYINGAYQVNLRLILPIFKMSKIHTLTVADPYFYCQKTAHEKCLTHDEWQKVHCPSIRQINLNTKTISLDVIDYLIRSCPNLEVIRLDKDVLKNLRNNISGGYDTGRQISFVDYSDHHSGFKMCRDIRIRNLLRDTYNSELYSPSMLRQINRSAVASASSVASK